MNGIDIERVIRYSWWAHPGVEKQISRLYTARSRLYSRSVKAPHTSTAHAATSIMALQPGASFEPDEHLATLVLRHVGGVRDRLALECVSRVWRAVGQIPGVWQVQDLSMSGDLATRLTDARVCQVLRRAGPNLRSLVLNDAPVAFTGEGLRSYAALVLHALAGGAPSAPGGAEEHLLPTPAPRPNPAFARLQSLDLSRCPGVTGRVVFELLTQLRIHKAPKAARLQRLALAGCDVRKAGGWVIVIRLKHSTDVESTNRVRSFAMIHPRGPRRKPGAPSYTLTCLSLT